jgi:hypothetical protein
MEQETAVLPKRLVNYIHDVGVRALDHLAESDKQEFVDKVATAVVEAVAASALLPLGLKAGKKAVKSARKVLKKRTKALRKSGKKLAASS